MKRVIKTTITSLLITLCVASAQVTRAQEYMVTVLGPLNPGPTAKASNHGYAINSSGQIAGSSYNVLFNDFPVTVEYEGNPAAFLYTNGTMSDLGLLPQLGFSQAYGLNDSGQVVGVYGSHAFLYNQGAVTDLGVLPNGNQSVAYGINNSGLIVGDSKIDSTPTGPTHAFLYTNGTMTDLNTLISPALGLTLLSAHAVNAGGYITGDAAPGNNLLSPHAYLYQNRAVKDLGVLPGTTQSKALALNSAGQVVGSSGAHAFLYSNNTMIDIGTLGGKASVATGINNQGAIVGYSELSLDPNNITRHAWIYRDGIMTDLTDLSASSFNESTQTASGVNDSGQIIVMLGPSDSNKNFRSAYGTLLLTPLINSAAPAPTGLTAVPDRTVGYGRIQLSWTPVTGAGFYRIYRGPTAGGPHQYVGRTHNNLTNFLDTPLHAGTTYYYEVVSCNSYGSGPKSRVVSATTTIAVPTLPLNVTATAVDLSHIDVRWASVLGASQYLVFRSVTASGPFSYIGQSADVTTYHDSSLQAGTTYYYQVVAANQFGQSRVGATVSATTLLPGFAYWRQVKPVSPAQIDLTWYASTGATAYRIYRGTTSAYHSYVGTTTTLQFSDGHLAPGTTYYYLVVPMAGTIQGPRSNEASATTLQLPTAPVGLVAETANVSQINLHWLSAVGASSYQIFRATSAGGTHHYVATTTASRFADTGLAAATQYWYIVVAVNRFGQSGKSNEATATTLSLPSAPTHLVASPASSSLINLSWTAALGASRYEIYRSTSAGGFHKYVGTTTALRFGDKLLASHTKYWYIVVAVNSHGSGPKSNEASATTL